MKICIYYFKFLFKNTKYLSICNILLIASMLITTIYLRSSNNVIESSFIPSYELFPFFVNTTNRIYFVLFMNVIPLLVAIPIGDILKLEKKCKYNILVRKNKHSTALAKVMVSFFCGFTIVFVMLLSSVLFANIILNEGTKDFYYYLNVFLPNNKHIMEMTIPFYNLLLSNPHVFIIVYIIILSILGGFYGLVTLSIGLNTNNILVMYCATFLFVFSSNLFTFVVPGIVDIFDPVYSIGNNFSYMIGYLFVMFIISIIGITYYIKKDVY